MASTDIFTENIPGAQMDMPNGGESSHFNPTREYFNVNFTKPELQRQCRELGLSKVWVTKDKLIDMLIAKHTSSVHKASENQAGTQGQISNRNLLNELDEMEDELRKKTTEIEQLNEFLQAANVTINKLSDRLSALEERVQRNERNAIGGPILPSLPPSQLQGESSNGETKGTLLLGDTNLTNLKATDLGDQCCI